MAPLSSRPSCETAHWIGSITMMMRKQKKKTAHTAEFPDAAVFTKLDVKETEVTWFLPPIINWATRIRTNGQLTRVGTSFWITYNFSGVVDLMGIRFDYPTKIW